jgi:hypothetical protein
MGTLLVQGGGVEVFVWGTFISNEICAQDKIFSRGWNMKLALMYSILNVTKVYIKLEKYVIY